MTRRGAGAVGVVVLAAAMAGCATAPEPPIAPETPLASPAADGSHDPAPGAEAAPPAQRQLRVLSRVMPAVERGGLPGCVTAQFVIHPDGRVGEIAVIDAKPGTRYVPATIAALKQWRFESFEPPALRGRQTFNFDPEQVRLPDNAVRAPFAVVGEDGALKNEPCRTQPPAAGETSKG